MARQHHVESTPQQESSRRQERAHRILDAAAVLIPRWGYGKTTLDDIAKEARVPKGTIYLHWKTKADLFRALIKREEVKMVEDIKRRVASDPAGSTLHGMLKHSALAMMKHPLMKAVILRDMDIMGELSRSSHKSALYTERLAGFKTYLEFLRSHSLIRTDLSLREQAYALGAIFMGFFLVAPLMPDGFTLSDEEIADLMAEAVQRLFDAGHPVQSNDLQAVSDVFTHYLEREMTILHEQFQQELES